jgi:hypothetical protein
MYVVPALGKSLIFPTGLFHLIADVNCLRNGNMQYERSVFRDTSITQCTLLEVIEVLEEHITSIFRVEE